MNIKWLIIAAVFLGSGKACSEYADREIAEARAEGFGDPCSPSHADQRYALEHEAGMDVRCDDERAE